MGGGLPQGVHQYYANTYNPAYPTPHGYAKGGEVYDLRDRLIDLGDDDFVNWAEKNNQNPSLLKYEFIDRLTDYHGEEYAKGGKVSVSDLTKVIKEKKLKGTDLPFFKVIGGKVTQYPMGSKLEPIKKAQYIRANSPQEASEKYTALYDNVVISSELDDDRWVEMNMAKGGMMQGYNDRLDESLGNTKGKRSTKEQNYKDRRNESEAMEKKGGKRKYARVKTMDKGNRKKKMKTPMTLAKAIRREGEKWQDAVKRASAMIRKDS